MYRQIERATRKQEDENGHHCASVQLVLEQAQKAGVPRRALLLSALAALGLRHLATTEKSESL